MAKQMREMDWTRTALGPPAAWPQPLLTALGICLSSRLPQQVWWGPDLTLFYNDASIPFLRPSSNPARLGGSGREAWGELWHTVGPLIEGVRHSGSPRWSAEVLMHIERDLPQEEAYLSFSFSPVFGPNGAVEGVFCACAENTAKVVSHRRLETLRFLDSEAARSGGVGDACRFACDALRRNPSDIPFAAIYWINDADNRAVLAAATGFAAGRWQPPEEVELHHTFADRPFEPASQLASMLRLRYPDTAGRGKAVVLPIRPPSWAKVGGLLVAGVNPQIPFDHSYRSFLDFVAGHIATNLADAHAGGMPPLGAQARATMERAASFFTEELELAHKAHAGDEARLRQIIGELQRRVAMLERECAGSRESRLAALNVMEDAVDARRALQQEMAERLRAEEAVAVAQERLRLIVESADEHAIISMDPQGRVTSWNSGAERIFGYDSARMIGAGADILFNQEDRAAGVPVAEIEAAIAHGRVNDSRWLLRQDGSRFWADGVLLPMRPRPQGKVVGFVKILRDETEKLRAREELLTALREMALARENAEAAGRAKDDFLAMLSHELRTPLTPILMATSLLRRRKDLPEAVREALEMIARNVQLEARFVDDLLDLSRIERGKMELLVQPLDMHRVIQDAVQISLPDIEAKGQSLALSLEARSYHLTGDAARLQQVVWNLLKNAAKFTSKGGKIHLVSSSTSTSFVLEVVDNGIGIEAEALPHVFDAFAQASQTITRQYGGLGLGLAISKASVAAHGGEMRVSSAGVGQGATFSVILPLSQKYPSD